MTYLTLEEMVADVAAAVRPPERLTVSQAAEKYRYLRNPGAYEGPWRNDMTPYLVEPMDELTSLDYTALILVGPAQCGKTDIALNWVGYSAKCDPADMMLVNMSQTTARDFSIRRLDRLFAHSPAIGSLRLPGRNNSNVFDTRFTSGMLLTLSWPSINELSGKPVPRLWLTDYDRFPQNVDDEGSPFDLARKRATTFGRHGMTVAESSPGFEIENPKWMPRTPHEAPPTQGILSLYNRGDRRRWYWPCPHCGETFEPDFHLLTWPDTKDHMEAAELAALACPKCGAEIAHDPDPAKGQPGKHELNRRGRWIKDGMRWLSSGEIVGTPPRSDIASFWIKGVAAAFVSWKTLVLNYLKALEEFEQTGSQEALKTTVNVDQGLPYMPRGVDGDRLPEDLKARAEDIGEREVPPGVRFLIATIDVQKNRFVVQVHGFGVGGDITIIDRFDIRKSKRLDEDGERYWVNPGAYLEDWGLLVEEVLLRTYPLGDGSGRKMQIKAVGCDSGGRAGVTANAYKFWRWLRRGPLDQAETASPDAQAINSAFAGTEWQPDFHKRFILLKGDARKDAPRVRITYPDSERKDRHAGARGEIPVLHINTDIIKDQLNKMLDRTDPHGGRITFPAWLPDWFYAEMTAETRTAKGWENPRKLRNEAWDLMTYAIAVSLSRAVRIEAINWDAPPGWANEWFANDLVSGGSDNIRFQSKQKGVISLSELAEKLA